MKHKINILFESDPEAAGIEVRICAPERDEYVEALIERISDQPPETLTVTEANGNMIKISKSDIISASVNGKLLQIITEKDRFIVRQALHDFEKILDARSFVRISRYEIVNLDKVEKFDFTLGGTLRLELPDGMETWASRRNIPLIRKKLIEKEQVK